MAEGPSTRSRVEYERKVGRRRRKVPSEDSSKEKLDTPSTEVDVPVAETEEVSLPECAVCLQTCVYPAKLPCSHIFCYLCLKGIASQSRRCAMCRQDIPQDYLEHPDLVQVPSVLNEVSNIKCKDDADTSDCAETSYQWFYEGRNGWWQYDERTSRELEQAYKHGDRNCELLIAGFLYVADFSSMVQMRKNEPSRNRRIKRDLSTIPRKGIAGIRKFATSTDDIIDQINSLTISSSSQVNNEDEIDESRAPS